MTAWVKKDDQVKEVQTEDVSKYCRHGWVSIDKPEEPKKGKKREDVEE